MTDLPNPLTPADCDLVGYRWMPLDVERVIDSDTFGLSTGDEFKTAFRLWAKSWKQVPAASLPNDDRLLAHLAGIELPAWRKRKEIALRGWILCNDGRLYHPVIAEKAIEAMALKEAHAEKQESAQTRQQRLRERRKAMFEKLRAHGIVPDYETGTAELERLIASLPPSPPVTDSVTDETPSVTGDVTESVPGDVTGDAPATRPQRLRQGQDKDRTVNLKNLGPDGGSGTPGPSDENAPLAAAGISTSLIRWERDRGKAARGINASQPQIIELADLAVTQAELRRAYDAAVADRDAAGDITPVNAGFVRTFVEKHRRPERPKREPQVSLWAMSDKQLNDLGQQIGVGMARPGEDRDVYIARIQQRQSELKARAA